jgi:DNA mismatch repair protein MutS
MSDERAAIPAAAKSALDTPMMRQYLAIKSAHPDAIVFYRMGDFYEMFLRDAEVAAPLLDIALTTRDKNKPDAVPMCGVPVHAADQYLAVLADHGHRVAICEQVDDARAVAGRQLVRREVVEVVTPALASDPAVLDAAAELALAAISPGPVIGLAVLDASTGDLRATEVERAAGGGVPPALLEELRRVAPRELLIPDDAELASALAHVLPDAARRRVAAECFDAACAPRHPDGLRADARDAASSAAAALLDYVGRHQPFALAQIARLRRYALSDAMVLDAATCAHLELFRNAEDGSRARTLIARIDQARTPLGARRLARWLAYPLVDPAAILARQAAVAFLAERDRLRARVRDALRPVRDLERLLAKAARPGATPPDLAALRGSLEALPGVESALTRAEPRGEDLLGEERPATLPVPTPVPRLAELLRDALEDEVRPLPRGSRGALETGYVRAGFHAELDGVREAVHKGREWIAGLEAEERARTGIPTLKIRFHPVHGYGIEVTKANLERVPADYERRQTLANAERFATPKLREIERQVRGGTERAAALEREIFERLRLAALEAAPGIASAAEAVAEVDALASLAEVARSSGWTRPEVDAGLRLEIRAGRHPVIEPLLAARQPSPGGALHGSGGGEAFVPNDTELDPATRQVLVLTGPNMSGKSTYLRQVALIVLLAQLGSYVPAEGARVGVVDRVFTRVGASDRLTRGESTFMVEMRETAEILAHASPRSLIILDEIGRGTSTFDGLSIAWAVAEYLHDTPGLAARTLFATHYHELTDLARTKSRVANAHFAAREWNDEVVFLRQLVEGGASRSYGIQVARLAGLPEPVIRRARAILANLEGGELDARGRPRLAADAGDPGPEAAAQLALFAEVRRDPRETAVLDALRALRADETTPIEALAALARWQAALREGDPS